MEERAAVLTRRVLIRVTSCSKYIASGHQREKLQIFSQRIDPATISIPAATIVNAAARLVE